MAPSPEGPADSAAPPDASPAVPSAASPAGAARPPLTVDDVVRIASYTDRTPTREAMVIAHAYHRIALDLAERLGKDAANWYCFAVWSSKAIGESLDLRKDSPFFAELGARLNVPGWFRGHFRSIMLGLLGPTYQLALGLANRSIFLETGSFAAGLVHAASGGPADGPDGALRMVVSPLDETPHETPSGESAAADGSTTARAGNGQMAGIGDGHAARAENGHEVRAGDGQETRAEDGQEAQAGDGHAARAGNGQEAQAGDGHAARAGDGQEARTSDGQEARAADGHGVRAGDGQETRAADGQGVRAGDGQGAGAVDASAPGRVAARDGRRAGPVRRPEFLSELLASADEEYLDVSARMFRRAMAAADPAERAELLLGANIALSAYEQARAQRALELVLYRPVRWLLRVSWRSVLAAVTRRPFHRLRLYITPHEDQPFLVRALEDVWAKLYTRYVLSLRTPVSEIRLGDPLVPPPGVDPEAVRAPIADPEVRALAERFGAATADGATSGVANWLSYPERMRFIVSYFRMYLTVPEMFRPPFDPPAADELTAEMELGEVPEPYAEWFEKKVRDHERRAARRGLRGLIVRQFYRSPLNIDPDAAELARVDVTEYARPRPPHPDGR